MAGRAPPDLIHSHLGLRMSWPGGGPTGRVPVVQLNSTIPIMKRKPGRRRGRETRKRLAAKTIDRWTARLAIGDDRGGAIT